ncbi:class I SAM-dependent methyltransferase [Pseudomaricurvus alkylphenolicus]|uniref:class I SAM-dependent methyltransferase n=1 Tax=Pseudomaricurvus alkylphenolicus TaxID=1306991 RepID=UPI00141F7095|nr:class I SAM-dependent methyltransferase [Pseudomaricurvus alkylphenolicus]NIB40047.1 class I SAM-dependent methyltransferase [Pseudomaricurvus alkylphenolicus]
MDRGYQYEFSDKGTEMFNASGRQKKAMTMVNVLSEFIDEPLDTLTVLNVGGSAGIIDEYLSRYFGQVTGIDIDEKAISYANQHFRKGNLRFELGDAMGMKYQPNTFDVVVCSQVYEHVPDAEILMSEIFRVLRPKGTVYFAAGNRIMVNEPHYNLPFLSVIPRPLAHKYVRMAGKGEFYHEKHFTYWGLKRLVNRFEVTDYTPLILADPEKYGADYMVKPGSRKQKLAVFVSTHMIWLVPGYIWVLKKPE